MRNFIASFVLGALLASSQSTHAEMMSAKTMQDVKGAIEGLLKDYKPEDILVAFDIDMTLTQPNHPATFYPALHKYIDIYKEVFDKLPPETKDLASTLTTQVLPQRLVEKTTPQIIRQLEGEGFKVIALTASLSGHIHGYPSKMAFMRRDQLQRMGIDFTKSFKDYCGVAAFQNFKPYAGYFPMFYHGILSTNGEKGASKGDVLVAFLRHVGPHRAGKHGKPEAGFYPKVVVIIDDKKKHLEDVKEKVKEYDPSIQVICIVYEGAYTYAPQDISKEDFQKFWEEIAKQAQKLSAYFKSGVVY